ncbi:MAG TPA: hypothetical protein VME46_16150, partial [Acidimicrobiales bacterium]|nr:hypothetical protein [Acidimicrobiales bacterium]
RRWALWSPGSDAPPLPAQWDGVVEAVALTPAQSGNGARPQPEGEANAERYRRRGLWRYLSTDSMARRPSMKSPYRLFPLVLVALILVVATYQAFRPPPKANKADIAAAEALKGKCLAKSGGTARYPDYSPNPVPCASSTAFALVVAVVLPGKGAECPRDTVVVRVVDVDVSGEPVECLTAVTRR